MHITMHACSLYTCVVHVQTYARQTSQIAETITLTHCVNIARFQHMRQRSICPQPIRMNNALFQPVDFARRRVGFTSLVYVWYKRNRPMHFQTTFDSN